MPFFFQHRDYSFAIATLALSLSFPVCALQAAAQDSTLAGAEIEESVDCAGAVKTAAVGKAAKKTAAATASPIASTDSSSDTSSESISTSAAQVVPESVPVQKGVIAVDVLTPARFADLANNMIAAAKERSPEMQKCRAAIEHLVNKKQYLKARANDALNSVFMYKGVSMSSEAGDIILDEKLKLNGKGAALLQTQKVSDELEVSTLNTLLEIAAGVGCPDRVAGEHQITEAQADLAKLVGDEQSAKAVKWIKNLVANSDLPGDITNSLTVKQTRLRSQSAVRSAIAADPIVEEVKADVHHYNTHPGAVMAAHRIVRTTLSIVSLAPNIAGPAAQAALFATVVLSGGSESSKVLKELYMDKRLESRVTALSEEVHLVFDNYKLGVLSKNVPLAACSEELLVRLTGAEQAKHLLHDTVFTETTAAATDGVDAKTAKSDAKADRDSEVVITVGGTATD